MFLRTGLLAAALLCSASVAALAQQTSGTYIGLGGGMNFARDADISGPGIGTNAEFDDGWVGVGSIGYGFGNGLRLELEVGYRENDIELLQGQTGATGSVNVWSGMLNLLYDIPTGTGFTPYLGVGGGYARVKADGARPITTGLVDIDDTDDVFAYQGILGVAYGITPNLKLGLDYRYFATQDPEFSASNGASVDSEYSAHTVLIALRWEFGAPARAAAPAVAVPPPPPPAPPPAPMAAPPPAAPAPGIQRSFLVFFDFDRSNITTEADRVISRGRRQFQARRRFADQRDRPCRPGRPRRVQHGPVDAPCRCSQGRAGPRGRPGEPDRRGRARRIAAAGADRGRRARGAEPPRGDRPAVNPRPAEKAKGASDGRALFRFLDATALPPSANLGRLRGRLRALVLGAARFEWNRMRRGAAVRP